MILTIDPDSPLRPFEQVRVQLAGAIDTGALGAAERLPTVRQLAADLGLAANTVARAYRELEWAGVVETKGRHGTFVAGEPTGRRQEAAKAAQSYAAATEALGVGPGEALAIVRRELERRGPTTSGLRRVRP